AGSGRSRRWMTSSMMRAPAETASSRNSSRAWFPTRIAFSIQLFASGHLRRRPFARCGRLRNRRRWRWRRCHFRRGYRRDGVLKNQLLLVISFQNYRIFVEPFDLSNQFYTADKKNGDGGFVASDSVEVNVLNVLRRRLVFH